MRLARLAAVRSEAYPFKSISVYPKPKFQTSHLRRTEAGHTKQASKQADRCGRQEDMVQAVSTALLSSLVGC